MIGRPFVVVGRDPAVLRRVAVFCASLVRCSYADRREDSQDLIRVEQRWCWDIRVPCPAQKDSVHRRQNPNHDIQPLLFVPRVDGLKSRVWVEEWDVFHSRVPQAVAREWPHRASVSEKECLPSEARDDDDDKKAKKTNVSDDEETVRE